MNDSLQALMREATRLTGAGRLDEATATLQRALAGAAMPRVEAPVAAAAHVHHVERGGFTRATHTHAGLTRDFKLYVPPSANESPGPPPLVVMLHGCKQDPDDFAAGTSMNRCAAEQGFVVLYPAQARGANPAACWNWFKPNHQQRGRGEPALIASLTQAVIKAQGVDPCRVYVAGLSAGGAMAAVMGQAYPDVFAAVGVHSGLPVGVAHDAVSALAVMKGGATTRQARARAGVASSRATATATPTIVFHGDHDTTVHPRNGEQLVAGLLPADTGAAALIETGISALGRRFTRSVHPDAHGVAHVEHWQVHGAGHAWSGGDASGSYTDPKGPDATREMLRFFFQHQLNLVG